MEKLDINLRDVNVNGFAQAQIDNVADDFLKDIENIRGTNQDDYIGADASNNTLEGLNGNDTIVGDAGADYLDGGDGDDIFKAGVDTNGDKVLEDADDGIDTIIGGNNNDTIDYSVISESIDVTLNGTTDSNVVITNYADDVINGIENVIGSSVNDNIVGDSNVNTLDGSAGDDTLYGAAGNDTLIGNSGTDTVDYTAASGLVVADLSVTSAEVSIDGDGGSDNLIGIERIIGSTYGDTLDGFDNSDTLFGGAGSDTISGGLGADDLNGYGLSSGSDSHLDTVSYAYVGSADEVTVNLSTGSGQVDVSGDTSDTDTLSGFENVIGGAGDDNITGSSVVNIVKGGTGADQITGLDGDDDLQGEAGNDTFIATGLNDGVDTIDGGADSDTVDYSVLGSSNAITLTLAEAGSTNQITIAGSGDADNIKDVENVIGSQGIDTITGNSGVNTIYGQAGNDILDGKAGDDSLFGEVGDDTLKGGTGDDYINGGSNTSVGDTVDYSDATSAVTVDMSGSSVSVGAGLGTDTLVDIENALGSDYDDTFHSDINNANTFFGGNEGSLGDTVDYHNYANGLTDSNDKIVVDMTAGTVQITDNGSVTVTDNLDDIENITATAGDDTIDGDSGVNTLLGLAGNDTISGGLGNDYLDASTGSDDRVDYSYSGSAVTVDLENGTGVVNGSDSDTLIGFENVTGTSSNDTIILKSDSGSVDGVENEIDGAGGTADTVSYENYTDSLTIDMGAGGSATGDNDILTNIENVKGGTGNDTFLTNTSISNQFDGNNGIDTLDYSGLSQTVNVTLNGSTATTVNLGGGLANDTVLNIENITGGSANDTIVGDSENNTFYGNAGDDTLNGVDGDDTLYGGNDNDSLIGGAGLDSIEGGQGNDTIDGGSEKDIIYGDDSANTLTGDDIIDAGAGNDTVYGGLGNDSIDGNSEDDKLLGGLGVDIITGGTGNDEIYGDDEANTNTSGAGDTLSGGLGNDTIYGGYGDDTLSGNSNDDDLYGGAGIDTVDYKNASSGVTVDFSTDIAIGEGTDTLSDIENAIGSTYDDVFISKLDVGNRFDGNTGNEVNGDSISYQNVNVDGGEQALDKVVMDLSGTPDVDGYYQAQIIQGGANAAATVIDYLKDIENITGSAGNDTLTGDNGENTLSGLAGNDNLSGQGGDDYLDGGAGVDTASYVEKTTSVEVDFRNNQAITSVETDTLVSIENAIGGSAKDTFKMNDDNTANSIDGQGDEDTISYEYYTSNGVDVNLSTTSAQTVTTGDVDTIINVENVTGSTQDDIFVGSTLGNTIIGGIGNDTFIAGTDSDNNDVIENVDDGADYFDGGVGTGDWVDYSVIADDLNGTTNGIEVTLDGSNEATVTVNGQTGTDRLLNVEHINGTQDNDSIKGDVQNNTLIGNAGADILSGEGGIDNLLGGADDDTLEGGAGDDTLQGGTGDDSLTGSLGSDKIYGGDTGGDSGTDTVDFTNALETLTIDLDLAASGGLATDGSIEGKSVGSTGAQGQGIDELYGIENIIGSNFANDTIYANSSTNIITAQAGDDEIEAREGADTIYAGSGDDTIIATSASDGVDHIDGDTGSDTLDYSNLGASNNISLNLSVAATDDFDGSGGNDSWQVNVTSGDNDIVKNVENVIGTSGDDIIIANAAENELQGGAGADTLSGNDGVDVIYGYNKGQSETVTEYDTVSYSYLTSKAVTLDLQAGTASIDANDNDTLISIENAIGGASNDNITGSSDINSLEGGAGDDTFVSSASNDFIFGGNVSGGTHTDLQTTGDTVDYSNSINTNNNVVVNLNTTANDGNVYSNGQVRLDSDDSSVYTDRLYGIENVSATSNDDTLTGNSLANTLIGNDGNDTLQGLAGADRLEGNAGDDLFLVTEADITDSGDEIIGGSDFDTINYNGITSSGVTVNLELGSTVTVNIGGETHTLKWN